MHRDATVPRNDAMIRVNTARIGDFAQLAWGAAAVEANLLAWYRLRDSC
jgi:hypothetical protein